MDDSTSQIKIAKINAWQAIIVALIGGIAGIVGTIGLKYLNYSINISENEKQLQHLEEQISKYEQELEGKPLAVLRVVKPKIDRKECLDRLTTWHSKESLKWSGSGFSSQETSYDGNFISQFGHFTVRVACSETHDVTAVSVSFLYRQSGEIGITEVDELAKRVIAVLQ